MGDWFWGRLWAAAGTPGRADILGRRVGLTLYEPPEGFAEPIWPTFGPARSRAERLIRPRRRTRRAIWSIHAQVCPGCTPCTPNAIRFAPCSGRAGGTGERPWPP